jgi:hypothetical protein
VNRLVFVLFLIVLIAVLVVGVLYLFQTKKLSFPNFNSLFHPSVETIVKSASQKCKDTGFATQDVALPYLQTLLPKTGFDQNSSEKGVISVVSIGNNCWGIWVGNSRGLGNFYYEDSNGNLMEKKSKFNLK